jgi:putative CocE/NonD family hydrolase
MPSALSRLRLALAGLLVLAPPLGAQPAPFDSAARERRFRTLQELESIAVIEHKVMVPMRDGVRLATDVYRPKNASGPVPIVFSRTPYNFNWWDVRNSAPRDVTTIVNWVKRGYAYVEQNERGKFFSEGEWDILGPPLTDGYDAVDWMSKQPWSNKRVGTIGCSSTAEWQMGLASLDHPAHAAMVPQGYGAGVGRVGKWYEQGNWYRGGATQMLFIAWLYGNQNSQQRPMFPKDLPREELERLSKYWDLAPQMPRVDWDKALAHLPVMDILEAVNGPYGVFADSVGIGTGGRMVQRTPNDPAWYKGGLYHDDMPFGVPSMWFMSWYDVSVGPNLALFNHVRQNAKDPAVRDAQYAVIAPVAHCAYTRATENTVVGERSMGDARYAYDALIGGWFDLHLKGERNGLLDTLPRVRYFTMGENKWHTSTSWPPAGAKTQTFFLGSGGKANTLNGDGRLLSQAPPKDTPDAFTYDPMKPVNSYGGNVCCTGNAVQAGAFDQRKMEERDDILVYTSEPLASGMEVSGPIEVTLYVSSDRKDTDFTVKLLDVYPDGRAYNLDETIQRVRWREGYDKPVWMEPGKVYKVSLGPLNTSNWFDAGHRIRIEVSSSNFPRFDRNMNTGGNNFDEATGLVARNGVHHSRQYPSSIVITVVPRPKPKQAAAR